MDRAQSPQTNIVIEARERQNFNLILHGRDTRNVFHVLLGVPLDHRLNGLSC